MSVCPVVPSEPKPAGMSAATSERKVGVAALPVGGPANTLFAVCVASASAKVPEVMIGLPDTDMMLGTVMSTLVTVPPPPPEPFAAAVMRPCASTVRFVAVYEPGVTAVLASANCPPVSVRPVPAVYVPGPANCENVRLLVSTTSEPGALVTSQLVPAPTVPSSTVA